MSINDEINILKHKINNREEQLRKANNQLTHTQSRLSAALEREQALEKERDALRIAEDHQISMRQEAERHIARLRSALAYASDYLNSNKLNTIGYASKAHCEMRFALASYSMIGSRLHPDDMAIDQFSLAMKEKMAASREKGRGGWEDPDVCTASQLAEMLISHIDKGNGGTFQDIANFAMMMHQRNDDPFVLATTLTKRDLIKQAEALGGEAEKFKRDAGDSDSANDCLRYKRVVRSLLESTNKLRQQAAALNTAEEN